MDETCVKKSGLFSLNLKDGIRSLFLTIMTAIGTAVLQVLNSGAMPDKAVLRTAGVAGFAAGLSYILKNFLTNSDDQMLKPEKPKP